MKEYIGTAMLDENVLAAKFPPSFKKQLKTFLFKMMREIAPKTKKFIQDEFSSLPKMRDFDWRLDVKIASKTQERMKKPMLYVKLDVEAQDKEDHEEASQVLF